MANQRTHWIVIDSEKQEFRCNRCGDAAPLTSVIGQRIEIFQGLSAGFIKAHKNCKENK